MSERSRLGVSRRHFVGAGVGVGAMALGAERAAAAIVAADLRGPHIDLTGSAGDIEGRVRLKAATAPGTTCYGWYDGKLSILSIQGLLRPICRVRGVEIARRVEGDGVSHIHVREIGAFHDLTTGAPVTRMANPFTGEIRAAPPLRIDWEERLEATAASAGAWRIEGDRLLFDDDLGPDRRRATMASGIADADGLTRCSERLSYATSLVEMQDRKRDRIGSAVRAVRYLPLPSWLGMDPALGACVYERNVTFGFASADLLPPDLMAMAADGFAA